MKRKLLPVAWFLAAAWLLGCRPERMQTTPVNPHTLAFAQAGVSLVVGEEWQFRNVETVRSAFPPTLVSRLGTIRVVLLPPDRSDPAMVADALRADFDTNPRAAKHSFRKQPFTNDNGIWGLRVSYLEREDAKGDEPVVENSHYLVKNRAGRCVAINYVAYAEGAAATSVQEMLRTSLKLQ